MMTHLQMLKPDLVLAEISFGGIIYMIAIFFWVISRLFKKKQDATLEGSGAPSSPRPVDAELKELFETITGQRMEPVRPPPPPQATHPAPAPAPAPTHRRAAPQRPVSRPPRAAAAARAAAPARAAYVPAPPPVPIWRTEEYSPQLEASQPALVLQSAPTMNYMMRSNSGRMAPMKLPAMRLGLGSASTSGAAAHMLEGLRQPDGMRAAMVQRVVLGPPRAFEPA